MKFVRKFCRGLINLLARSNKQVYKGIASFVLPVPRFKLFDLSNNVEFRG